MRRFYPCYVMLPWKKRTLKQKLLFWRTYWVEMLVEVHPGQPGYQEAPYCYMDVSPKQMLDLKDKRIN